MGGEEIKQLKEGFRDIVDTLVSFEKKLDKIDHLEQKLDLWRTEISSQISSVSSQISGQTDKLLEAKKDYVESLRKVTSIELIVDKHEYSLGQLSDTYKGLKIKMDGCQYCRSYEPSLIIDRDRYRQEYIR